ncbi:hypothetical protein [Achromobacter xylosoxidans]|uniref:hypothetical protein n=1 Tax=Alcaligenes xylosoxydans xylosoxydans TaxID=85698 RepID=UPI0006C1CB5D|nr:hypothetical protein [Achromobacter xylosoxidans]MCH4590860.1 hypothetical protein [Achromobacter xylosoxidans]MCZ8386338.1 hypothetical protein [Achromobacter xylosoxidans]CUI34351.1 Uncharacterised protein [Achromobacter xylosoxidans]CUI43162.1 Uncharacterised protein [Achromobacter xylosoxidans]
MAKSGTYYLGRVLKLGLLNQDLLIEALKKPQSVKFRGNAWTFLDVEEYRASGEHFIFGRLSKYSPEGEVGVVDESTRSQVMQIEPNLLVASSPFVYIPAHSGIAFLNVPGQIEIKGFISRFCEIVEHTHNGFFVDCDIDLVSDLKTFAAKLLALDGVYRIEARISPPNPLFSPLWAELEKYLRERNTDRMTLVEDAPDAGSLKTDLPQLVKAASEQTEDAPFVPDVQIPIGDAAILMAADGYGAGIVKGKRKGELVVIRTSETAMNFMFEKNPQPYGLYERALELFDRIEKLRHMEHGE